MRMGRVQFICRQKHRQKTSKRERTSERWGGVRMLFEVLTQ
jgi:hypothetical protein